MLPDLRRLVRVGGFVVWIMVGVPLLLHGALPTDRVGPWACVYALFAVALWASTGSGRRSWLLVVEVLCVFAMVLLLCDGFEGALLVLVALQLGERTRLRVGVVLVVLQTALLAAAVAIHWTPGAALLLAPAYLGFSLLALFVAQLLVRLARANDELRAARALVEENTRLGERLRIARDLHDVAGHRLTAIRLNLEVAARFAEGRAAEPVLASKELAKQVLEDVRGVVAELRDDARVDLATALHAMAAEMPSPRVHLALADTVRAEGPRALTLLRCAQEIVTNAARHASAENLWIDLLDEGHAIALVARDDGRGADAVAIGRGLSGMRERLELEGGSLEIATSRGKGFSLRATLPARGVAP